MIKRLFLGTTEVNFINVGKTFYKFFIVIGENLYIFSCNLIKLRP